MYDGVFEVLQWLLFLSAAPPVQLLTLVRPSEASGARWVEIDLDAKLWTIPAERMKAKREHIVPLSPQALDILEVMKPISAHREHVFPSRNDPKKAMNSQTA